MQSGQDVVGAPMNPVEHVARCPVIRHCPPPGDTVDRAPATRNLILELGRPQATRQQVVKHVAVDDGKLPREHPSQVEAGIWKVDAVGLGASSSEFRNPPWAILALREDGGSCTPHKSN
jgi:hypothetical protein